MTTGRINQVTILSRTGLAAPGPVTPEGDTVSYSFCLQAREPVADNVRVTVKGSPSFFASPFKWTLARFMCTSWPAIGSKERKKRTSVKEKSFGSSFVYRWP